MQSKIYSKKLKPLYCYLCKNN